MLFKLHYFLIVSSWCASSVLLGVFVYAYTDASPSEMGYLYMTMPFISIFFKPMISSAADRRGAHREYLLASVIIVAIAHLFFVILPFLGPEVYVTHARTCWYIIVVLKVIGEGGMNGSICIGDALAMNYARRLGVEFMVYRIWGTIAWMTMGFVIGQINEVSFLPKYAPGFIMLVCTFLLDAVLIWLWPKEYFRMVSVDKTEAEQKEQKDSKAADHLKCLMPKEVVLAHMRNKLLGLVCMSREEKNNDELEQSKDIPETTKRVDSKAEERKTIDKVTQFRILLLLLRRDPRVLLYLSFFAICGIANSPLMFFFVGLADRCQDGLCDFSQLAGMLQFSMAFAETILFVFVKQLKARFGRLTFCILAALLAGIEYSIYANYWDTMNPNFVVLTNSLRGVYFGSCVVLMSDAAFMFANEVIYLLPELRSKGVINDNSESYNERLKLSLAATMQAITSAANDGLGRGLGALLCGLVIENYSYKTLWLILSIICLGSGASCILVRIFDQIVEPNLGLDVKAELEKRDETVKIDDQIATA